VSASIGGHLVSGGGGGRRQFWAAALDAFRSRPITGRGAGSFAAWWAEHPRLPFLVRDAHSLYLETLAELGLVGFALLVGAFSAGLAGAARKTLRAPPEARPALAGLTAIFLAYVVAASFDWMWELTVVTIVAVFSLGLAAASETSPASSARRRITVPLGPAMALAAAACAAELAPLVHNV
jgi:O-antigen ligase